MTEINHQRRKWLSLGGAALGIALIPHSVFASISTTKPSILRFKNINSGEVFTGAFDENTGFDASNLKQLNQFLRDKLNHQVHHMDPKLFHKFYRIQQQLGLRNTEIQIICGYRSPSTNAAMRRKSKGVASNSFHMKGQAIDFRIDGVPLAKLHQTALNLHNGGVGYYPHSNFIHIDTGPVRNWRGS